MHHPFRLFICLLLAVLLASCASTEKRETTGDSIAETGNYKYDAWRLDESGGLEAINVLLDQADVLMQENAYDAAEDKLERALRIKPEYAPAWSRLSWLALQTESPKRSVQMAKRSNSFAASDPELQSLNWSFIRTASELLDDEETYTRASQKIESLKAF
jgi:Tfp pilus assembly protein PilF